MAKWADAIDDYTSWMRIAGKADGTIALRRYHLRQLAEANLRRSPWRISTDDLIRWMAAHDWQPGTRQTYVSTLRGFYGWAHRFRRARRNPAADLPPIRLPRRVPRPTPDDVWLAAMASASDRDRLVLALGSYAGMRRGEIAAARWDWIGADHIRVTGKGGHTRLVPLHPQLGELLDAERDRRKTGSYGSGYRYQPADDGGFLFPGRGTGTHLRPEAIGRAASRVLGPAWALHSTRHRFGTRAYAGSRDLAAVQDLLGHSSPTITRGYTRVSDHALRAAVDSV